MCTVALPTQYLTIAAIDVIATALFQMHTRLPDGIEYSKAGKMLSCSINDKY